MILCDAMPPYILSADAVWLLLFYLRFGKLFKERLNMANPRVLTVPYREGELL